MCVQCFNEEALDFQSRVLARSGLGEETYLPIGAIPQLSIPPFQCATCTNFACLRSSPHLLMTVSALLDSSGICLWHASHMNPMHCVEESGFDGKQVLVDSTLLCRRALQAPEAYDGKR